MANQALVFGLEHVSVNAVGAVNVLREPVPVDPVEVVDVDVIDLQPFERVFEVRPPAFFVVLVVVMVFC